MQRPSRRRRACRAVRVWPYPLLVLILLVAGGEAYLWVRLQAEAANATQLAVLQTQVADLRALAIGRSRVRAASPARRTSR